MIDDPHLVTAREFERSARHTLAGACSADIAILDRLCADAFANARAAFKDALRSAAYDQSPGHELLRERARVIAEQCTRQVRDTVNVRFRARFRSYTEAVWENESRLVARPRRIALPRIRLRAVEPAIRVHASSEDIIEAWMLELTSGLRTAVSDAVAIAVEAVIKRIVASVSRSRTARTLSLRSVTPS